MKYFTAWVAAPISWLLTLGLLGRFPQAAHQGLPAAPTSTTPQPALADEPRMPKSYALTIAGYNYTDRVIYSFEVDGHGGGNMGVSTPTSSAQGGTCCYPFAESFPLPMTVQVAWVGSYCRQTIKGWEGESQTYTQPIWKVATTQLQGPIPAKPTNMEVHIYPDGHVEVAIADRDSPARLKLPADETQSARPGLIFNDPSCPPDYDRAFALDKAKADFKKAQQSSVEQP